MPITEQKNIVDCISNASIELVVFTIFIDFYFFLKKKKNAN